MPAVGVVNGVRDVVMVRVRAVVTSVVFTCAVVRVVVVGRVVGGVPGVVGLLVAVLVNRVLRAPMFTGVMRGLCGRLVIRVRALRVVGIVTRGFLA